MNVILHCLDVILHCLDVILHGFDVNVLSQTILTSKR